MPAWTDGDFLKTSSYFKLQVQSYLPQWSIFLIKINLNYYINISLIQKLKKGLTLFILRLTKLYHDHQFKLVHIYRHFYKQNNETLWHFAASVLPVKLREPKYMWISYLSLLYKQMTYSISKYTCIYTFFWLGWNEMPAYIIDIIKHIG